MRMIMTMMMMMLLLLLLMMMDGYAVKVDTNALKYYLQHTSLQETSGTPQENGMTHCTSLTLH